LRTERCVINSGEFLQELIQVFQVYLEGIGFVMKDCF